MKTLFRIVILFLFCLCSLHVLCQRLDFEFGVNYGGYNMEEVKEFQEGIKSNYAVDPETMSNFPAHIGFDGRIGYTIARFRIFVFGSFNSSGSRLSYQDYSGSFEYNQLAKFKQIGAGSEFRLNANPDSPWAPFVSMQTGIGKTDFNVNGRTEVAGQTLGEDNLDFVSSHLSINPSIGIRRKILDHFFVSSSVGYFIDIANPLQYKEDRDLNLLDDNYDAISVNWSGFRIALSLRVRF